MWCGPDTIRLGQCQETVPSSAAGLACGTPPIIPPSMSFMPGLDEKSDAVWRAVCGDTAFKSR